MTYIYVHSIHFVVATCSRLFAWNGQVTYDRSFVYPGFYEGTKATFSCDSGYRRSGPRTATCQSNGKWSRIPTCKKGKIK